MWYKILFLWCLFLFPITAIFAAEKTDDVSSTSEQTTNQEQASPDSALGSFLAKVAETFATEKTGFVGLFSGQATYNDQANPDSALGSFFLIRLFEEYDLFLGALTYANFSSVVNKSSNTTASEETEVTISTTFLHRGFGTSLAYVYSTETFVGGQFWLGSTLLYNEVDIRHKINEEITRGQGSNQIVFQCAGEAEESASIRSLPLFVGFGGTLNDFGFFIQYLQQNVDNIPITSNTDLRCLNGTTVEIRPHADNNETINLSFQSTVFGVQYRF